MVGDRLRHSTTSSVLGALSGLSSIGDILCNEGLPSIGGFGVFIAGKNPPLSPFSEIGVLLAINAGAEIFRCVANLLPAASPRCPLSKTLIFRWRVFCTEDKGTYPSDTDVVNVL